MSQIAAVKATPDRSSSDVTTLAAIGVLSHIVADVIHEVIGHAGTALVSGGRIILLTSVFFRSDPGSRFVDAAGPTANLIPGFLFLGLSKRTQTGAIGFFFLLAAAFNLFWCAGYFLFSAGVNQGDWALVIRGWPLPLLWRTILFGLGPALYAFAIRQTLSSMARLSDQPGTLENSRRVLFVPYFAAGVAAIVAALFSRVDSANAFGGAIREAFLTNAVLLIMPHWMARRSNNGPVIHRDPRWIFAGLIAFVIFVLTMGRGVVG